MTRTVAVIVGSLREGSLNRKLAKALETATGGRLRFDFVAIGDLPLYNDDLWREGAGPAPVMRLRRQVEAADGVLVVSPEYNRGFPGLVANAFDWGSRPAGQSCWRHKPAAVAGATRGASGTAAGQQHLRLALVNLLCVVMHGPELYVTWTDERFAEDGTVRAEDTRALLERFMAAFADWIEKHG